MSVAVDSCFSLFIKRKKEKKNSISTLSQAFSARGAGRCSCPTQSSRGLAALPDPSGASHCGKTPLAFHQAGAEPAGSEVGGGRGKLQPPPKLGMLQMVVLGKENWKTKVPDLQLVPGVSGGGWCSGLEAPQEAGAPGLAWPGAEPKAFPPSWFPWRIQCSSAGPALGTSPCCACSCPAPGAGAFPVLPPHGSPTARAPLPLPCPSPAQNWKGLSLSGGIIPSFLFPGGAASTVADASEPSGAGGALSLPVLGLSPLPHFLFLPAVAAFAQGAGVGPAGLFPSGLFPSVPRAPNPALGSAQRARELLC